MANKHTIILMQTSPNKASRTFMDYESISQAMDGICGLYERKLKELNPAIRNITYDIADLYNFIDGLADMSALVTKVALCSDFKRIATIVVCSYYSLMEVLPCPGRLMVILGSDDENEKETTGKYGLLSIVARLAPQAQ
ncbi:enhancer of rudimentary homolog isoform X3 [Carya illinoinensis]|uniref:enhancer of rudimentary homolog isoform X3 n=1 Tax=Carya illinoinensis TaxID=32201 RepID=UPI001C729AB2|nr:enhancer of rudimentary homolog isoform X3 [Carya illinoinensis]